MAGSASRGNAIISRTTRETGTAAGSSASNSELPWPPWTRRRRWHSCDGTRAGETTGLGCAGQKGTWLMDGSGLMAEASPAGRSPPAEAPAGTWAARGSAPRCATMRSRACAAEPTASCSGGPGRSRADGAPRQQETCRTPACLQGRGLSGSSGLRAPHNDPTVLLPPQLRDFCSPFGLCSTGRFHHSPLWEPSVTSGTEH